MNILGKLAVEILILWVVYALYMAILVHKRGPVGGIFFYPKAMQERTMALELITKEELESRRRFAYQTVEDAEADPVCAAGCCCYRRTLLAGWEAFVNESV